MAFIECLKLNDKKEKGKAKMKIIAIEYSKKNKSLSSVWDEERVKKAFNFGHGTIENLKEYAENNRQFCTFVFV